MLKLQQHRFNQRLYSIARIPPATRFRPSAASDIATVDYTPSPNTNGRFKRPDTFIRTSVTGLFTASLSLSLSSTMDVPDYLRLFVFCYFIWSAGEWIVHRYGMHAPVGSWADKYLHINSLHVTHHKDTHKDMKMAEEYELDALYFHLPNTAIQGVAGFIMISLLNSSFSLNMDLTSIAVASFASAFLHSFLWNSLHLDMHEVKADLKDGVPAVKLPFALAASYQNWVVENHTIHHECGGGQNYNVVLPGPDIILGTYLERR